MLRFEDDTYDLCCRAEDNILYFFFFLEAEDVIRVFCLSRGLGNAATPLGIRAARRMAQGCGGTASHELCLLVVLNSASIQLLPTTVAGVRSALGSADPFDILPAVWTASLLSVLAGLAAAKLFARIWRG